MRGGSSSSHGSVSSGAVGAPGGGSYALAAARGLVGNSGLPPRDIVQKSLEIAAEICVYTNTHITILEL